MPDPNENCDAACVKLIIDGQIMIARAKYLIEILEIQTRFAARLRNMANAEELAELLENSVKQCDFSKEIEASANETAYLMSEIAAHHAGLPDEDDDDGDGHTDDVDGDGK